MIIGRLFAVDFYLNNTIGREKIGLLNTEQKYVAETIRRRLLAFCKDFRLGSETYPVERANAESLIEIKNETPSEWFAEFLKEWIAHIEIAHIDRNAAALGRIPGVREYIDDRRSASGMSHTLPLAEVGDGLILPWSRLAPLGFETSLRRLHVLVGDIGSLLNDLFSFENEFIDCSSDSNLIAVIALNDPTLSLIEAIGQAATIVRSRFVEFLALIEETRSRSRCLQEPDKDLQSVLDVHLRSLDLMAQSCWTWQLHTRRYRHQTSIWRETQTDYRVLV